MANPRTLRGVEQRNARQVVGEPYAGMAADNLVQAGSFCRRVSVQAPQIVDGDKIAGRQAFVR